MSDPKENNLEYGSLFRAIALAIDVNLQTPMEKKSGRYYYAIKATSRKSKNILRHYFDTYPLLTSKFLDYRNWCAVDDLLKKKDHHKHLKQIQLLKGKMNSCRKVFTWDHLHCL
jgi:LAGLIDADG endonuclease